MPLSVLLIIRATGILNILRLIYTGTVELKENTFIKL